MARKGTIKNMGKVQREMGDARKARAAAKAAPDAKASSTNRLRKAVRDEIAERLGRADVGDDEQTSRGKIVEINTQASAGEHEAPTATETPNVKKTKSGVRINLWGFGAGEIVRWMGKHGFTTAQATAALAGLGCPGVAPPTIRLNLASGRQGIRGEAAALTEDQAKMLLAYKE